MARMYDTIREMVAGDREPPPIARLVGFTIAEIEPGRCVVTFTAGERHHNPMGILHGGVICDVADAAMGLAYASTLGEGESFTTVELKANFLRPVREGPLTATATVAHGGRTIGLTECEVRDAEGRLIAKLASTCMTLRR